VPDVGGWRRERLPEIPDVPWLGLAPDWVCEVLSPSTTAVDRSRKLPPTRGGSPARVAREPREETLEVLRLREGAWTIVTVFAAVTAYAPSPSTRSSSTWAPSGREPGRSSALTGGP